MAALFFKQHISCEVFVHFQDFSGVQIGHCFGSVWVAPGPMATASEDLLERVKQRFPDVALPGALETLRYVHGFLSDKREQNPKDATHEVLSHYSDSLGLLKVSF